MNIVKFRFEPQTGRLYEYEHKRGAYYLVFKATTQSTKESAIKAYKKKLIADGGKIKEID
jgi:hypothetical protein